MRRDDRSGQQGGWAARLEEAKVRIKQREDGMLRQRQAMEDEKYRDD